jgi:hypothetical protein
MGFAAGWTVSPQTGEVMISSTYESAQDIEPNAPNCVPGFSGEINSTFPTRPNAVGIYRYEPWVIYTYGEGGYQYPEGKEICINQPFTRTYRPFP